MLRYGSDRATLPLAVLDREIAVIRSLGVAFRMGFRVGGQRDLDELIRCSDAVVFATGTRAPDRPWPFDIKASPKGIAVEAHTFATGSSGVFACGGAIAVCRMAVRAVGQGRLAAQSVHHFLTAGAGDHSAGSGNAPVPVGNARHSCSPAGSGDALVPVCMRSATGSSWSPRFDSHLGKLEADELQQLVVTDLASEGLETSSSAPFSAALVAAASRCLQCDCGKKYGCALRAYAQEYEINRDQYKTGARKRVTRTRYASGLVFEPGKCIDCGRCVGITAADHIQPGLAFGNRGFDVTVKAPFSADMDTAMGNALDRCIAACPVGALWKATGAKGA